MNTNKINPEQNSIDEDFLEFKGIFSRHYLKTELLQAVYWPKDKDISAVFEECRAHFHRVQKAQNALNVKKSGLNESDTETELIDKILPLLGFHFLKRSRQTTGVPDYVLFADDTQKDKALPLPEKERYQFAVALLEAKSFHLNLNRISKEDTPGKSYHRQIHLYLQDAKSSTEQQSFNWGILTNGDKWRLYSQDVRTNLYFELDLEVALQNLNSFKYFMSLFERNAFIRGDDGLCRLDHLRKESQSRQEKLETDLRKRIFALVEILAKGFISISSNNITDNDLPKVYDACLILLYRLLFVLYAEGKELLPVHEHGYGARKAYRKEYALRRYQTILPQRQYVPEDDAFKTYWSDIGNLFDLINGTDKEISDRLKIPRYNGGLFDPEKHPELVKWKLGNWTMQELLKGLIFKPLPSTSDQTINVDFNETVDYATLEVQRLGSIYEGLLEWKLDRIDGNIKLVPTSEKRKETGSYYTPDWVVDYIIHETIDPLIVRIEESSEVKAAIDSKTKNNSFCNSALKLRILDPAMGSGHFLVRATEYLADQIAQHLTTVAAVKHVPPGLSEADAERAYWRRRVVESCIFGVDINPLAVELAKLSLWLTCISPTNTLNFLDHHVRTGNALVGSTIGQLSGGKYKIEGMKEAIKSAVERLKELASLPSDRFEEVKQKQLVWERDIENTLLPYRRFFNLRTAHDFGVWHNEAAFAADMETALKDAAKSFQKVDALVDENCFFHWELAFPEVFDPDNGEPGFDAVIGNPPYESAKTHVDSKTLERRYINKSSNFTMIFQKWDIYIPFIERGLKLLRNGGYLSLIVPRPILNQLYAKVLRDKLINTYDLINIVDLSSDRVFEEAQVENSILVVCNRPPTGVTRISRSENRIIRDIYNKEIRFIIASPITQIWDISAPRKRITDKLKFKTIGDFCFVSKGMVLNADENRASGQFKKAELISDVRTRINTKPYIEAKDIDRYRIDRIRWLEWNTARVPNLISRPTFPQLYDAPKILVTKIGELKSTYDEEGLICDQTIRIIRLWNDLHGVNNPSISNSLKRWYNHPRKDLEKHSLLINYKYLLAILNSRVCRYLINEIRGIGNIDINPEYLKKLPVPIPNKETNSRLNELVQNLLDMNQQLSNAFPSNEESLLRENIKNAEEEVDNLVYELFVLTDDEVRSINNNELERSAQV